jgi:hypothetical protein
LRPSKQVPGELTGAALSAVPYALAIDDFMRTAGCPAGAPELQMAKEQMGAKPNSRVGFAAVPSAARDAEVPESEPAPDARLEPYCAFRNDRLRLFALLGRDLRLIVVVAITVHGGAEAWPAAVRIGQALLSHS